jgi:hypothetical protein
MQLCTATCLLVPVRCAGINLRQVNDTNNHDGILEQAPTRSWIIARQYGSIPHKQQVCAVVDATCVQHSKFTCSVALGVGLNDKLSTL